MMRWWNITVAGPPPEQGAVVAEVPSLEDTPTWECEDVSLHVPVCGEAAREVADAPEGTEVIEVFGERRVVDEETLSVAPRFERAMSAVFLDSMDDLQERILGGEDDDGE